METLTHYQDPQSRSIRTSSVLDYYQIQHESVQLDIRKGDLKKPEYAQVHPYRRVPALQHGDFSVVESGAIVLYLADLFPEKMNTPAPGTLERARLYEWMFFLQATLEPVLVESFRAADDQKQVCRDKIRELLSAMAAHFRGPFVLGETFCVLDVVLFTELSWYRMMGFFPEGLEPYASFMVAAQNHMGKK